LFGAHSELMELFVHVHVDNAVTV